MLYALCLRPHVSFFWKQRCFHRAVGGQCTTMAHEGTPPALKQHQKVGLEKPPLFTSLPASGNCISCSIVGTWNFPVQAEREAKAQKWSYITSFFFPQVNDTADGELWHCPYGSVPGPPGVRPITPGRERRWDAAPQQVRNLRALTMMLELSSGSGTRGRTPDSDRTGSYSSCRSCG